MEAVLDQDTARVGKGDGGVFTDEQGHPPMHGSLPSLGSRHTAARHEKDQLAAQIHPLAYIHPEHISIVAIDLVTHLGTQPFVREQV